ncbi:hypothetical protein EV1_006035 [Malus domestica]
MSTAVPTLFTIPILAYPSFSEPKTFTLGFLPRFLFFTPISSLPSKPTIPLPMSGSEHPEKRRRLGGLEVDLAKFRVLGNEVLEVSDDRMVLIAFGVIWRELRMGGKQAGNATTVASDGGSSGGIRLVDCRDENRFGGENQHSLKTDWSILGTMRSWVRQKFKANEEEEEKRESAWSFD